jgi:hypothetical protein
VKITVIAAAVALFGLFGPPASAATLTLDVPLTSDPFASTVVVDATLRGTLTYDDDHQTGSGTFTISGLTDTFSGYAASSAIFGPIPNGSGMLGIGFLGDDDATDPDDVTELYFNINVADGTGTAITTDGSGTVMWSGPGVNMSYTSLVGTIATDTGAGGDPNSGDTPLGIVSSAPLPPAAALFGSALLGLACLGRRRRPMRMRARA